MKTKYVFWVFVFFIVNLMLAELFDDSQEHYNTFYDTTIEGEVDCAGIKHHGSSFKIKGNSTEFVFYPYTDKYLNKGHIFSRFAKRGDSIIKPAKTDTLFLKKQGQVYKYTFEKIGE